MMTIKGLGPIDPVNQANKASRTSKAARTEKTDSVNVSKEARDLGEIYKAAEEAKSAPELRLELIAEVKEKLKDPDYINDKVIDAVADDILKSFGIG